MTERGRRPVAHAGTRSAADRDPEWVSDAEAIRDTIGYVFRQPDLLDEALTHKSHANELKQKQLKHNERLEFVGDAVLTLLVSEYLAKAFPVSAEGELSKRKAQLVSEASLAQAAKRARLGLLLRLGRGEELSKGREKTSLLANVLEAILGAIYLDGGLGPARDFVLRILDVELKDLQAIDQVSGGQDYKTQIQEWCQREYETLPRYETVREFGPDHQKTFEVQLKVRGDVLGVGTGRSKKEAEQMAAKEALKRAAD